MITLLSGAKKNIGDFLIAEKAKQVISHITGEKDFLFIDRWLPFDDRLEEINATRAVMVCGGPAYSAEFYPKTLPLVSDLERIKVPVVPVGLGLAGMHPEALGSFSFSKESLKAIRRIHEGCEISGVRDRLTLEKLKEAGIENVVLSGCPVMYDLASLGKPFVPPAEVRSIVLTPPAGKHLFGQTVELARRLKERFPKAEMVASFHRGIRRDTYTSFKHSLHNYYLVHRLEKLGIRCLDTSYDLSRIDFYRECDLHVGYRVHAHVNFVSYRKASFLLQEDTRGIGMSGTLGTAANDVCVHDADPVGKILAVIERERDNGFASFSGVPEIIDSRFKVMTQVLSPFRQG